MSYFSSAVQFNMSYFSSGCLSCDGFSSLSNVTSCSSTVQFADEEIIYTVSTRNVQSTRVVNVDTSVEPEIASMLAVSISQSLEAASIDLDIDFADAVNDMFASIGPGRSRGLTKTSFTQGYLAPSQIL